MSLQAKGMTRPSVSCVCVFIGCVISLSLLLHRWPPSPPPLHLHLTLSLLSFFRRRDFLFAYRAGFRFHLRSSTVCSHRCWQYFLRYRTPHYCFHDHDPHWLSSTTSCTAQQDERLLAMRGAWVLVVTIAGFGGVAVDNGVCWCLR